MSYRVKEIFHTLQGEGMRAGRAAVFCRFCGCNLWSGFTVLGMDISGIEDFLVSQNILPLGSLLYVLFCTSRKGWGWDAFLSEANQGQGLAFPKGVRAYVSYVLPAIVLFVFIMGYWDKFGG